MVPVREWWRFGEESELPSKFRLPRVASHRSHHEKGDDKDTEAAIHRRV